jgi:glucose-6-phosphate 1-dehydrogenase
MDACPTPQAAAPCAIVIFGASGDLTKRKLLPSLYNLGAYHLLPAHFSIIGVARRPLSDDIFRDQLGKDLAELGTQPVDPNLWSKFRERISYCAGEFDNPATYKKLAAALSESETKFGTSGNAVFVSATRLFRDDCEAIGGVRFIAGRERPLAQGHYREAVWT